jgi:ABC-2 type transport system permease protein
MRKVLVIARREYRATVRSKAFVISLVLMPILMGGSVIAQGLVRGRVDLEDKRLVVADASGRVLALLARAAEEHNTREIFDARDHRQVEPRFRVEAAATPTLDDQQRLALSEGVRQRRLHAFVEIGAGVLAPADPAATPAVHFHTESALVGGLDRWFARVLTRAVQAERLRGAGLDPSVVARAMGPVPMVMGALFRRGEGGALQSGNEQSREAAALLPVAVALLVFMALMMSQSMLQSTLEEKQQRIAEVLLGSARPFELMLGKIAGGTAVSLTKVGIYLAGGSRVLRHLGHGDLLRGDLVGWLLLFVAIGMLIYGALFAAVGAACNEVRETQNFVMPLMLVLIFPLMVITNVLKEPLGGFATALSMVPLWTPMMMPLRLAATQAVPCGSPSWARRGPWPRPWRSSGRAAASSAWACSRRASRRVWPSWCAGRCGAERGPAAGGLRPERAITRGSGHPASAGRSVLAVAGDDPMQVGTPHPGRPRRLGDVVAVAVEQLDQVAALEGAVGPLAGLAQRTAQDLLLDLQGPGLPGGRGRAAGPPRRGGLGGLAQAQGGRALGEVAQLADVARPGTAGQLGRQLGRQGLHQGGREEAAEQGQDVGAPLAQGGDQHRQHRHPEVEVLAEGAEVDHAPQVAMGGADEADVHPPVHGLAQPPHQPRLQGPQNLGLHRQRQLADLVDEQGSPVGRLDGPGPGLGGAGEGPLDVAEKLGLQQALRQRPAVDDDEGAARPGGGLVEGAGHQLLAGPGLALDQHRRR